MLNRLDNLIHNITITFFIVKSKDFITKNWYFFLLSDDKREVIFGTVKNCFKEPVKNAVVKLIEIDFDKEGRKKRFPVSHTFTDEYGEFVFGPLCSNKYYEVEIWADFVQHCKICKKVERETKCLKGVKLDCKNHDNKPEKPHDKDDKDEKPEDKPCGRPC